MYSFKDIFQRVKNIIEDMQRQKNRKEVTKAIAKTKRVIADIRKAEEKARNKRIGY